MVTLVQQKLIGKIGEDIVEKIFIAKGYTIQKLSIEEQLIKHYDFLVTKGDISHKLEVKYDRSLDREQEACFETRLFFSENNWQGKPGWTQLYSTISNVKIVYVLPSSKQLLIIPARRLKEIDYRQFRSVSKDININCSMTAHYIPLDYLVKFGTLVGYEHY